MIVADSIDDSRVVEPGDPIVLVEYGTCEARLTPAEAVALARISLPSRSGAKRRTMVAVSPSTSSGHYRVTADSVVGSVMLGDRPVVVRPKVGAARTLFMASQSPELVAWWESTGLFERDLDFHDLMTPLFLREVDRLVRDGLLQDYRNVDEAAPYIRGRVRFADQVRHRRGLPLPVEISYEELSFDILENQLLKAALAVVTAMPSRHMDSAGALLGTFEFVDLVAFDPQQLPVLNFTVRNDHYRAATNLAKVILRTSGVESAAAGIRAQGMLFDLNKVFEDFVFGALQRRLMAHDLELVANAAGKDFYLAKNNRIALEPDISIWDNRTCMFIGDIKYKNIDDKEARSADLYQALSYATAAGQSQATLIYAGSHHLPDDYAIVGAELTVRILSVDITARPMEVIDELEAIADAIAASAGQKNAAAVH
jgi:5-methylcytosine-specific restriction enzyme subunit McrC